MKTLSAMAGEVPPSPACPSFVYDVNSAGNRCDPLRSDLQARVADDDADQDTGDIPLGVDEDALDRDELDTDTVADPDVF